MLLCYGDYYVRGLNLIPLKSIFYSTSNTRFSLAAENISVIPGSSVGNMKCST